MQLRPDPPLGTDAYAPELRTAHSVAPDPQVQTFGAGRRQTTRANLQELWANRGVLWALTLRVLISRNRQTLLGLLWTLLQSTSVGVLAALLLGRFVALPALGGTSYLVFVLAGIILWTSFARTLSAALTSIREEGVLLGRVWFPREILPLSRIAAGLPDLALALVVLLILAVATGNAPTLAWLLLPVPVILLVAAGVACSLAPAGLNVLWRDLGHVYAVALQVGFFATPILYPLSVFPKWLQDPWAILNPVVAAMEALRNIVLAGKIPDLVICSAAFGWAAVGVVVSYRLLKRLEPTLADRL